jgi:hypothetical protein
MRKSTLVLIAFLIEFPVVHFSRELLWNARIPPGFWWRVGTSIIVSAVVVFITALLLEPLNRRILDWRKARGRDIEEEERYEDEYGIIRLTLTDKGK